MTIEFKNFGAIKQGQIDLAPLTILCGPNNTSKTYALYAAYGLFQKQDYWNFAVWPDLQLSEEGTSTVDLREFLLAHWDALQKEVGAGFTASLAQFFAADEESFRATQILFQTNRDDAIEKARELRFGAMIHSGRGKDGSLLEITKKSGDFALNASHISNKELDPKIRSLLNRGWLRRFTDVIHRCILPGDVLLLPAERGGLNLFHNEITGVRTEFVRRMTTREPTQPTLFDPFEDEKIAIYAQPIADYINVLSAMDSLSNQVTAFTDIAASLEAEVLGGNYSVNEGGAIRFAPREVNRPLDLHLSSSTSKSYFGLWFYLQHLAEEGDTLMIDEPELNLHPDNQRRIARIFARMVGRGIRVVLSTHSDYIVRELNNLLILGHEFPARDKLRGEFGYKPEDRLDCDNVRAYCFGEGTIQEMEMSPDEGIIAETFDHVINELNDSSYDLASAWAQHREEQRVAS